MNRARLYKRGADKERKIVLNARKEGKIAFRSAGSHSPIDVCIIDVQNRSIELIQAKSTKDMPFTYIEPNLKKRLEKEMKYLDGTYSVEFKAL